MSQVRYVSRSTDVAARMVGDELMIMRASDSMLFVLNATAAELWKAADGVTPLESIVRRHITAQFEVDHATAIQDAENLLTQLAAHGVVRVSDVPLSIDRET